MLEILVVMAVIAIMMAKHGRRGRRRMGRYIRGNVNEAVPIGTLDTKVATSVIFDNVVNERTLVSSLIATWSIENWTAIAQNGPFVCGVAHSDYNTAEIEEYIEATASWNEGNLTAQEVNQRKIRRVTTLNPPDTAADIVIANDGKPIKTKLNWIMLQGQSLQAWVYNDGTVQTATTAPVMRLNGHANLWPR